MKRIIIADDHAVVRAGLRHILGETEEFTVVGEAATAQTLFDQIRDHRCDIVILDIALGEESGLDVLATIREEHPEIAILVLSMFAEEEYAIRVLKLGASGYLTKESAPDRLLEAVRKIASGGAYLTPTVAERLAGHLRGFGVTPHSRLSNREFQILVMIGEGQSLTDIARLCHLSVKTVSTHRRKILDKMGLSTTSQLIRYAVENRLSRNQPLPAASSRSRSPGDDESGEKSEKF